MNLLSEPRSIFLRENRQAARDMVAVDGGEGSEEMTNRKSEFLNLIQGRGHGDIRYHAVGFVLV